MKMALNPAENEFAKQTAFRSEASYKNTRSARCVSTRQVAVCEFLVGNHYNLI